MQKEVYFSFFILCAILSHGTLAKFLEKNVGESSELLDRQKRVIDRRPGKEMPLVNGDLPYIANIKKYNQLYCIASILSRHNAITAARCMAHDLILNYAVYSGSSYSQHGDLHNITESKLHGHNPSRASTFQTGIALITVDPPFAYSSTTGSISLHSGPVLAGMQGIAIGWGFRIGSGSVESQYSQRLRFISVPIMNHRECVNIYSDHFPIRDEDVCTYHPQKLCGNSDIGAPLVIGRHLVGVHIGPIEASETECPIKPDVFALLQHENYRSWIMRNIVQ